MKYLRILDVGTWSFITAVQSTGFHCWCLSYTALTVPRCWLPLYCRAKVRLFGSFWKGEFILTVHCTAHVVHRWTVSPLLMAYCTTKFVYPALCWTKVHPNGILQVQQKLVYPAFCLVVSPAYLSVQPITISRLSFFPYFQFSSKS